MQTKQDERRQIELRNLGLERQARALRKERDELRRRLAELQADADDGAPTRSGPSLDALVEGRPEIIFRILGFVSRFKSQPEYRPLPCVSKRWRSLAARLPDAGAADRLSSRASMERDLSDPRVRAWWQNDLDEEHSTRFAEILKRLGFEALVPVLRENKVDFEKALLFEPADWADIGVDLSFGKKIRHACFVAARDFQGQIRVARR